MKSMTMHTKNMGLSATQDVKNSAGASGGITYSTIANIPKAKRNKLILEAKPMVSKHTKYKHLQLGGAKKCKEIW